jgi:hypothetical protein
MASGHRRYDIGRAVTFWTRALYLTSSDEWHSSDWRTLYHRDGGERALGLQRSESPPSTRSPVYLDLFVDNTAEQQSEVGRLTALDASEFEWDLYPPDPDFVVLSDPDGNLFAWSTSATRPRRPVSPDFRTGRQRNPLHVPAPPQHPTAERT